jgi:hypothetical protein
MSRSISPSSQEKQPLFDFDAVLETARQRGFECLVWAFDNAEHVKKRPPPRPDALQQAMIELNSIIGGEG